MKMIILLIAMIPSYVFAWQLPGVGDFKFEPVAKNVYVMHGPLALPDKHNKGFMNNPGIIVGDKGIIMIDPGSSYQVGKKILQEAARISKKPVVAVFNTHIHGDHWLGNHAVKEAYPNVKIFGHKTMIAMANDQAGLEWLDIMNKLTEGATKDTRLVVPENASKDNDKLEFAGQHFKIHSINPAHTSADIMIEHVESKTLFTGDNSFNKRLGRFDNTSSMHGNIKVLQHLKNLGIKTFVPGHGKSGSYDVAVKPFYTLLSIIQKTVMAGYKRELENYEIKAGVIKQLKAYRDWAGFDEGIGKNVAKMYLEVEELSF
ncbi:MAG: MBL fold metallo-hydrolase [Gammaproteobacteria bacterium]|nr:MBL fold metallo-hydrolase [Gammaproteobacteria bacterium]